jgi:hypothetical protein
MRLEDRLTLTGLLGASTAIGGRTIGLVAPVMSGLDASGADSDWAQADC